MKIRNGFVSNSSSSSFIVALNPKEKCPHCGRSSPNMIDLIEKNTSNHDETEMGWDDPTDFLEDLQQEIYNKQLDLEKWANIKDEDKITNYYNSGNSYTYTVGKLRKWANERIKSNSKLICDIKQKLAEGKRVVKFDVDYHDSALNNIVSDQISNGELEVIYEN